MEATVYNQKGKETSKITLPDNVFGLPWNADLVHQVVSSMESNKREPIAHTKNRGDVSGGGKKPWKQKGTGRARHGSTRSPIWVGGGVAHGPRNEKNYERKVNKKMKAKALYTILSSKFKDGKILFIDYISGFDKPKTKDAKEMIKEFSKIKGFSDILSKRNNSALISMGLKAPSVKKSLNNFSNFLVKETSDINPLDLINSKYVVIVDPKESIETISNKI